GVLAVLGHERPEALAQEFTPPDVVCEFINRLALGRCKLSDPLENLGLQCDVFLWCHGFLQYTPRCHGQSCWHHRSRCLCWAVSSQKLINTARRIIRP